MALQTHKDLKVWQQSKDFVSEIFRLTATFPKEEMYSLTAQIKRSAISIPSNIAEGSARESNKEYIRFLYIALGSLAELDTQLQIANDLKFIKSDEYKKVSVKLNEIGKMLSGLISYRKNKRRD